MDGTRLAPLLGIAGCLAALGALATPYALVADASAVGVYYATGAINPLLAVLFCAVSVVVFAAGRQGRTDPALAAGVALVFGVCIALVAAAWALTVPESVVFQLSEAAALATHRWALVAVSLSVPAAGAWYARALGLL
ncbi:hypothetical protein BRC90_01365 [Halobacteriales archaeon QS_4_69_34]|nr:MAG: hypothetical protein BRC90_01365 [Halobacteriales archaeon QS_4_69_34]